VPDRPRPAGRLGGWRAEFASSLREDQRDRPAAGNAGRVWISSFQMSSTLGGIGVARVKNGGGQNRVFKRREMVTLPGSPLLQPQLEQTPMNVRKVFLSVALLLTVSGLARAADLAGKWTSEFDSQIGPQKYAYDFSVVDGKLTGKATYDHSMGKGENALTDISVKGEDIRFVETMHVNDMEIVVTYTGKFVGEEVHLKREVGEFAVEDIVLKRAKDPAAAAM